MGRLVRGVFMGLLLLVLTLALAVLAVVLGGLLGLFLEAAYHGRFLDLFRSL